MKTEDEARKCWCPFVRFCAEDEPAANRWSNYDNPPKARCIASECMAWRWINWHHEQGAAKEEPVGYCGLAGNPE